MTASTLISGNEVDGDIAGRDIHKNTYVSTHRPTAMAKLVAQYLAETLADQTLTELSEKLEHYMSNAVNSDVRGLEEKLQAAGRDDQITVALRRKQSAYKAIMRQQGSRSAQTIFTFLMAEIVTNFEFSVLPLVKQKAAPADIDSAMLEKVITPALMMLEENPLMLDKMDIQGLVYFLAGNCYIRWD